MRRCAALELQLAQQELLSVEAQLAREKELAEGLVGNLRGQLERCVVAAGASQAQLRKSAFGRPSTTVLTFPAGPPTHRRARFEMEHEVRSLRERLLPELKSGLGDLCAVSTRMGVGLQKLQVGVALRGADCLCTGLPCEGGVTQGPAKRRLCIYLCRWRSTTAGTPPASPPTCSSQVRERCLDTAQVKAMRRPPGCAGRTCHAARVPCHPQRFSHLDPTCERAGWAAFIQSLPAHAPLQPLSAPALNEAIVRVYLRALPTVEASPVWGAMRSDTVYDAIMEHYTSQRAPGTFASDFLTVRG